MAYTSPATWWAYELSFPIRAPLYSSPFIAFSHETGEKETAKEKSINDQFLKNKEHLTCT